MIYGWKKHYLGSRERFSGFGIKKGRGESYDAQIQPQIENFVQELC